MKPLDHPFPGRPHRIYAALTNACNRACPWCSTCSSPRGSTWLDPEQAAALLPADRDFELQLEGGEPTIHPRFAEFVALARRHPRCTHLILCTNGVVLPRDRAGLEAYLRGLGTPLTVKLSVNHHLLDHDPGLIPLSLLLRDAIRDLGGPRLLVLNVRLRRGVEEDDRRVREAVASAGLLPHANVFFLQRYWFASDRTEWDPPAPVSPNFSLVNPDGAVFGPDVVARSEAMRRLDPRA